MGQVFGGSKNRRYKFIGETIVDIDDIYGLYKLVRFQRVKLKVKWCKWFRYSGVTGSHSGVSGSYSDASAVAQPHFLTLCLTVRIRIA